MTTASVPRKGGVSALFAHRAHGVEDEDPRMALYRSLDYYPTPPWAARACCEIILRVDSGARSMWEPACGQGHLAHGAADYFDRVVLSDIHAHGAGAVIDFLSPDAEPPGGPVDWIFTNPPFVHAEAFVRTALTRARRGVAMLVRLGFLESIGRYALFSGPDRPALICPFAERVPMHLGRYKPKGGAAAQYCLFIWVKPPLTDDWPDGSILRPVEPGRKVALSRTSDMAFAGALS